MSSLVQDLWWGTEPRRYGRRLAPYAGAPARLLLLPDDELSLEDPLAIGGLECLAAHVEVIAFEPPLARSLGVSDRLAELRRFVDRARECWPDDRPLIVAGHGTAGPLALLVSDHSGLQACAALAPALPAEASEEWLALAPAEAIRRCPRPTLVIEARDEPLPDAWGLARIDAARTALLQIPGDRRAAWRSPWLAVLAAWTLAHTGV